ncbi:unnamed protein product [Ilex paraguariensis]|uniref:Uncharacterized protein n=1 Tax=Ilex paraguariensis TaxID=185542 RepID=A0ABC8TNC7_9AQUA
MEEPKASQTMAPNLPPQPPQSNKRPLDNIAHFQNSNYYKIRAVVKDLRPHFLEVLRTPDFQKCKAANDIQEKMKLLMDLYKEMTAETVINVPGLPLSGEIQEGQKPKERHQDLQSTEQPPPDRVDKPVRLGNVSDKQRSEHVQMQGTYVVGGSAFGWNFITYPGSNAVYYGRTKESFRAANVLPP